MKHTGSLDVSDDGSGLVVHELDAHLGDTTTGACRVKSVSLSCSQQYSTFGVHRKFGKKMGCPLAMRAEISEHRSSSETHTLGSQEPKMQIQDGRQNVRVEGKGWMGCFRTGSAEDSGHLDQLDGGLGGIHCGICAFAFVDVRRVVLKAKFGKRFPWVV